MAAILINLQTAVADIAIETDSGANRYKNYSHCLEIMWISPHLMMESGTVSGINRYRNCSVSNFSCNQRHQPLWKLGSGSRHRYGNPGQPFVLSTAASTAMEISGDFVLQTVVVDIAVETKWIGSNPLWKLQSGDFGCIQRHQPLQKLVNSGTTCHKN